MVYRELRKTTPTLLAVAAVLILALVLSGCGKPVPPAGSSVQPPAVSAPGVPAPADPPPADPAPADPAPAAQPSKSAQDPLTKAQAEAVALNHAGLTAGQVKGLRSEFDVDDGVQEWDVEFWHDGWEYDYEINAVSGAIRAFDKERD